MNSSMKFLLTFVAVVTVVHLAKAAISVEVIPAVRNNPNRCIRPIDKFDLAVGQTQFRSGCSKVTCKGRQNVMLVETESCGVAVAKKGCRLVEDKSKNHPECCPKEVC